MPAIQTKYRERSEPSPRDQRRSEVQLAASHLLESAEDIAGRNLSDPEWREAIENFHGDLVTLTRLLEEDTKHALVAASLKASAANSNRLVQLERRARGGQPQT